MGSSQAARDGVASDVRQASLEDALRDDERFALVTTAAYELAQARGHPFVLEAARPRIVAGATWRAAVNRRLFDGLHRRFATRCNVPSR